MQKTRLVFALCLTLILGLPALSRAEVKTFAVTPFTVHGSEKYQYLGQGIQSMLYSRLTWPNHLQPVDKAAADKVAPKAPASDSDASKNLAAIGCDYLVFGSLTVSGDQASLDMTVMDADGKKWPKTLQTKLNDLIPAMEATTKNVNAEIFKRVQSPASGQGAPETINQMNPAFVVNQTNDSQKVYLNPNFRYAGSGDTPGAWRSQSLPYQSFAIDVGDINADGKNEVVVLGKNTVETYVYEDRQLKSLGKYEAFSNLNLLNLKVFDYNGDGKAEIIVSAYMNKQPRSFILSFNEGRLVPVAEDLKFFLSVAKIPPDYSKSLIGGKYEMRNVFADGVYNMIFSGGQPMLGTKLNLPKKANPFNFVYLPEQNTYKVVLVDDNDRLIVYTPTGERIAQTEETFCGSGLGLEFDPLMAPMDKPDQNYLWAYYYIPLPLIAANFDGDERYELIVSKNISIAAQFFENFRAFSQGEIHAMYWDGVGLNLKWKTRRIKGTISGYLIGDLDNDGADEMVVSLNTYPGAVGFLKRRTIIMAYELDVKGGATPSQGYSNDIEVVN